MTVIHKRKGRIARLATVVLAAAAVAPMLLVVGTGTSYAACAAFKFNGQTEFRFNDGSGITFLSFDERVAPTTGVVGVEEMEGSVLSATGGIVNGRTANVTVNVAPREDSPGGSIIYRGEVSDNGTVSGTATIKPNGEAPITDQPFFSAGAPLICSDAPKQINVSWQEFIGGIKATVSMSNNKGQVGCTYSTQGLEQFDRRFTLTDDQPTDVTISPAVPLFRVWPVTITCDNGVKLETERFY